MPTLDINRYIDKIRAQPGANFLAFALKEIQDAYNQLPASTATTTQTPATKTVISSGGGAASASPAAPSAASFAYYVNGQAVQKNSVNFNNALPSASAGSVNGTFQIDPTMPNPNLSVSVPTSANQVDLTAQHAAITGQLLLTPSGTGQFFVSYYAKITTAASASSILGGTTGFVLSYTDGTDSTTPTLTLPGFSEAGAIIVIGTGNVGNATTSIYQGSGSIYALAGAAITFNFGYSSTGATAMAFEIHSRIVGPL